MLVRLGAYFYRKPVHESFAGLHPGKWAKIRQWSFLWKLCWKIDGLVRYHYWPEVSA
jgi:hypothetical protein